MGDRTVNITGKGIISILGDSIINITGDSIMLSWGNQRWERNGVGAIIRAAARRLQGRDRGHDRRGGREDEE